MEVKTGIYKITSPSNKIYIGQSININKRFNDYKKVNCKTQIKLYRSFKKYNIENHIFEIIEECLESELNTRERYYQDYYNVIGKNGLNCRLTKSNDKSGKFSIESRLKMSKLMKGNLNHMFGKTGKNHIKSKQVFCTRTLNVWESITECAKELKISQSTLSRYLLGIRINKTTIKYLINE